VAQQQLWLETTTGGHRSPRDPDGQREISQLGRPASRISQQHRIGYQVGVQHQHRPTHSVTGPSPTGIGQSLGDSTAQPPSVQRADLRPLHLTVERVGQPGLQPPPVGVYLHQPPGLDLLHRQGVGQFRQH